MRLGRYTKFVYTLGQQMVINNLKGFLKNFERILQPKKAVKNRVPKGNSLHLTIADFYTFFKILKFGITSVVFIIHPIEIFKRGNVRIRITERLTRIFPKRRPMLFTEKSLINRRTIFSMKFAIYNRIC